MMDAVSVIPENTEIFRCRFQSGKAFYSLLRVGDTLRIGIFRHTPHTLDGRVSAYQFLYHIHVRACGSHGNCDHLYAEIFCDLKVTVISRCRAQEFYFI